MKKRNFWAIVMVAVMALGGCGSRTTKDVTANTSKTDRSEIMKEETAEDSATVKQDEVAVEPETKDINSLIVEKTDEELDLKQFLYSYEDRTMDKEGERVFDTDLFNATPEAFVTTDKVDIYNVNGIRVGYALENVELETFGEYNGWYYFYLDGNQRFSKAIDIKANCKTQEQVEIEAQEVEENVSSNIGNTQDSVPAEKETVETSVEQPVVDAPVTEPAEPQANNKYTPDEAIAVYRSLMEAGGITWDPSIKDGGSWGTGWIFLEKGQPEWCASTDLESFAMGDSGGRSWTKYYLEVTGSDDEAVYITEWHSN